MPYYMGFFWRVGLPELIQGSIKFQFGFVNNFLHFLKDGLEAFDYGSSYGFCFCIICPAFCS